MIVWNHPLDMHFYTNSVQGWPKVMLETWKLDAFGGKVLCECFHCVCMIITVRIYMYDYCAQIYVWVCVCINGDIKQ